MLEPDATWNVRLQRLEQSVQESLRGRQLTEEQWSWLRNLRDPGRSIYDPAKHETLRPLRNAGLIREHPEGTLTNAKELEITHLGRLLVNARDGSETIRREWVAVPSLPLW